MNEEGIFIDKIKLSFIVLKLEAEMCIQVTEVIRLRRADYIIEGKEWRYENYQKAWDSVSVLFNFLRNNWR